MKPVLVIVGLGNPGASYEHTRHNAGWRALDVLAREFGEGEWVDRPKFLSHVLDGRIVTAPILFVKPNTFMNRSGEAVRKLVDFYKLNPAEQLLVLSDDIDLPLGVTRFRRNGGPGTHNGLKSVVEQLGEGFPRIRIGLGAKPQQHDLANWVLSAGTAEEERALEQAYSGLPDVVRSYVLGPTKGV